MKRKTYVSSSMKILDLLFVLIRLSFNFSVSHLETLKHEKNELQQLLQNQKYTPADVERINREKRELQQTITSLSKALEDAEINRWNEEINVAKVKETVCSCNTYWREGRYRSHRVYWFCIDLFLEGFTQISYSRVLG